MRLLSSSSAFYADVTISLDLAIYSSLEIFAFSCAFCVGSCIPITCYFPAQSFPDLPHKPILVDMVVETNRTKVLYASTVGKYPALLWVLYASTVGKSPALS